MQNESPCRGQISYLNRKREDARFDNLVYLCLKHHDEYDGRTSQSKGYQLEEVREYRNRLTTRFPRTDPKIETAASDDDEFGLEGPELGYRALELRFADEIGFIGRAWRYPLWQVGNRPDLFAYKAGNGSDGVCLLERVDLPDGRIVVACIEVAGNPGMSITNCVEELCFQVCPRFEIPASRLVWLEHYYYYRSQDWSMVVFEKQPPQALFSGPK